jgi:hypothetical protein
LQLREQHIGGYLWCRFVELDRCAAAAEAGYAVGLFKVLAAETMAKNDLLVGVKLPPDVTAAGHHPFRRAADEARHQDAHQQVVPHLISSSRLCRHLQLQNHLLGMTCT